MKCHVVPCQTPAQPEHSPCCPNHDEVRLCCSHFMDGHAWAPECVSDIHPSVIA